MKLIEPVLDSYLDQIPPPDAVYIHIPPRYIRFPNERIQIPSFLNAKGNVHVCHTEMDWGPATKVLGAMLNECIPDDMAVLVSDDDCRKRKGWAQLLLQYLSLGRVCSVAPIHYGRILFGGGGYAFIKSTFHVEHMKLFHLRFPEALYIDDELWTEYCKLTGIDIRFVNVQQLPYFPESAEFKSKLKDIKGVHGRANSQHLFRRAMQAFQSPSRGLQNTMFETLSQELSPVCTREEYTVKEGRVLFHGCGADVPMCDSVTMHIKHNNRNYAFSYDHQCMHLLRLSPGTHDTLIIKLPIENATWVPYTHHNNLHVVGKSGDSYRVDLNTCSLVDHRSMKITSPHGAELEWPVTAFVPHMWNGQRYKLAFAGKRPMLLDAVSAELFIGQSINLPHNAISVFDLHSSSTQTFLGVKIHNTAFDVVSYKNLDFWHHFEVLDKKVSATCSDAAWSVG